jgi:hypothetical protein
MCSDLLENGVKIEIMWNPFHLGLGDNMLVGERARHAALNGVVIDHFRRWISKVWQDLFY